MEAHQIDLLGSESLNTALKKKTHKECKEKFSMVIECNYSEKLNSLPAQTCNAHLCHHLAMGESLFESIPLQKD